MARVSMRGASPRAWQRMLSGRRLDLLDPSPLDVEIEDIAHGLARVARWNGQTQGAHIYSVAQHSLLVEAIASVFNPDISNRWRLTVLLHDAPEYVIGDIISPFKAVLGDGYKGVENRILAAIHLRFGLPAQAAKACQTLAKRADGAAAFLEATRLAGFSLDEAAQFFPRPAALPQSVFAFLEPWTVDESKTRFLARFDALTVRGEITAS
ncbi:MAG: HD domain-containing protein [Beijerinckiaceae bacterium]